MLGAATRATLVDLRHHARSVGKEGRQAIGVGQQRRSLSRELPYITHQVSLVDESEPRGERCTRLVPDGSEGSLKTNDAAKQVWREANLFSKLALELSAADPGSGGDSIHRQRSTTCPHTSDGEPNAAIAWPPEIGKQMFEGTFEGRQLPRRFTDRGNLVGGTTSPRVPHGIEWHNRADEPFLSERKEPI